MCGLAGYIGKSKKPHVSYEIITHVFSQLETRGTDAAGIWGDCNSDTPTIVYDKAPVKSSEFVKLPVWTRLQKLNPSLLLVHARATSPGIGHAKNNTNNHPFVSSDKRIGLVHNGKINEIELLKQRYETKSQCDSEVLLRMYESALNDPKERVNVKDTPDYIVRRLAGLRDIWSLIKEGSMAVALGEMHHDKSKSLFLFRNQKRPLWVADLRASLGQVFFFSSVEIWHNALAKCKKIKDVGDLQRLTELPVEEIWYFRIEPDHQVVTDKNFFRFSVHRKESDASWEPGEYRKIIEQPETTLKVISEMGESEEPVIPFVETATVIKAQPVCSRVYVPNSYDDYRAKQQAYNWEDYQKDYGHVDKEQNHSSWEQEREKIFNKWADWERDGYDWRQRDSGVFPVKQEAWEAGDEEKVALHSEDLWAGFDDSNAEHVKTVMNDISDKCKDLRKTIDDIETSVANMTMEGSIDEDRLREICESLDQSANELAGTLYLIK